MSDYIAHYGTPHEGATPHSGRYPWGSGEDGYERDKWFLSRVRQMKEDGMSESEIAKVFSEEKLLRTGASSSTLRANITIATYRKRKYEIDRCERLKAHGYSNEKIAEIMGLSGESQVRALLAPGVKDRNEKIMHTANLLKKNFDSGAMAIDIGKGVESRIGVSRQKMDAAIEILKEDGYVVSYASVDQLGTAGNKTTVKFLMKPKSDSQEDFKAEYKRVAENWKDNIVIPFGYSEDGGATFVGLDKPFDPIKSVDSKRILVVHGDVPGPDGFTGSQRDGVIMIRPGVKDISLGASDYAQVRIAVDDAYYMKGMAVYSDNIPEGYDVIYNSNKKQGTPRFAEDGGIFKKSKTDDLNDPLKFFGSTVRQTSYIDENGNRQTSTVNIVNEEGTWDSWGKNLSSQFLSKQTTELAHKQLSLDYAQRKEEFESIMSLTNPTVKQLLLDKFADSCDSAAVDLKAASMPRQQTRVLLPVPQMKENEIYAPAFRDGEQIVCIRYPFSGNYEMPVLKVNNKVPEAKKLLGNKPNMDAVAINPKVAEQMSGADFDGDYVICFPIKGRNVKTAKPIKELVDFDTKSWKVPPELQGEGPGKVKRMTSKQRGQEMGSVSNLITDMTLIGCSQDELIRAVKYSMVVIDAKKHYLDYKAAYKEYNIAQLKTKYQGGPRRGASTLISAASGEQRVGRRTRDKVAERELGTGEKVWKYTEEIMPTVKVDKTTGKKIYDYDNTKLRTIKSTKMYEVDDAFKLSSGHAMEAVYAEYANAMKALSNDARKAYYETPNLKYSPSAKQTYKDEVNSLNAKLELVNKNKPLERRAQIVGNAIVAAKREENPDMDAEELRSIKGKAIVQARKVVGSKKPQIEITDKEWAAIEAGAISDSKLKQILNNTDLDKIKERATPRKQNSLTPAKIATARAMLNSGYTQAEVADKFGVSVSTLTKAL